jgi:hypothetical protein
MLQADGPHRQGPFAHGLSAHSGRNARPIPPLRLRSFAAFADDIPFVRFGTDALKARCATHGADLTNAADRLWGRPVPADES